MALFGGKKEDKDTKAVATTEAKTATKKTTYDKDLSGIIRQPRITEKATLGIEKGAYVFEVDMRATKTDIKKAVEKIFGVKPKKVSIVRMSPQAYVSRARRRRGQHSGFKKAYVHLNKGETLDIMK